MEDNSTAQPVKTHSVQYLKRINTVLDYLDENYASSLNLQQLAEVANFSSFHFHRIFKGITGESLNKYIQRIRLEKAAHRLKYDLNESITNIAIDCGFSSSAAFAKTFKQYFNMSASQWRSGGHSLDSKNRQTLSNSGQDCTISPMYIDQISLQYTWDISMKNINQATVTVKQLEPCTVAYIRHIGPFIGESQTWRRLFDKLTHWVASRGLLKCPGSQFYTVFRDQIEITDFAKFKADVCVSVDAGTKAEGEVGVTTLAGGKYAVALFEIDAQQYEQAWGLIYSHWLPGSGYQPDQGCCFEKYLNDFRSHPQQKHIIEIYIPIKPL
ncbi:MAG: hypothetical protein OFPI_34160 [Osedax symbiont Rs2]|nr:MAG: hypothetical protein OFPI_34160 [Osedax symbiont Rs2]